METMSICRSLGLMAIQARRQGVVSECRPCGSAWPGFVGQIGLHADVAGRIDLHPAGILDLAVARVGLLGLDDGGLVAIGIDAIAARPEGCGGRCPFACVSPMSPATRNWPPAARLLAQLAGEDRPSRPAAPPRRRRGCVPTRSGNRSAGPGRACSSCTPISPSLGRSGRSRRTCCPR